MFCYNIIVAIYCIILDYFHCILGGATPRVGRMFGIRYHRALRRHLVNALTYMIFDDDAPSPT